MPDLASGHFCSSCVAYVVTKPLHGLWYTSDHSSRFRTRFVECFGVPRRGVAKFGLTILRLALFIC
jgi:hypothetical protein